MSIRIAEQRDLPELLAIYNHEVLNSVANLDLTPRTLDEWQVWFDLHNIENHPLFVAEIDGRVAGYTSLSSYREKEAFRSTVELSIYVAPEFRRRGLASELMAYILDVARADERTHLVISVISAQTRPASACTRKWGLPIAERFRRSG